MGHLNLGNPGQVELLSWKYYLDFVYQKMLDYETYVWRGHSCDDWLLESTLDRLVETARIPKAEQDYFRRSQSRVSDPPFRLDYIAFCCCILCIHWLVVKTD